MCRREKPKRARQGQIYYVDLKEGKGSEQMGRRPLLIISSDQYNRNSPTVIMVSITSKIKRADLNVHIKLPPMKGLNKESMVEAENHFTVDKSRLEDYCGRLPWYVWIKVHRAIRFSIQTSRKQYEEE